MNPAVFIPGNDPQIAARPLSWWLARYELPLHLYYAPVIRRNLQAFKEVFARLYPKGRVCFAAKACTHSAVLKIAQDEGCGADVASYNEARCALEAGIPAHHLDLNGNCKEDFLIRDAIVQGMNIIADGMEEMEKIEEIAAQLQKKARVLLRISGYDLGDVTADSIFTAGLWTKFGAPLETVPECVAALDRFHFVQLVGFHTHIGSQITVVEPYLAVMGKLVEMAALLNQMGGRCEVINIGGGFPVAYVDQPDWDSLFERIREGYAAAGQGDYSKSFVWHDGAAGFADESTGKVHLDRWTGERFFTDLPKEKMLEALLSGEIILHGRPIDTVKALKALGEPKLTVEPGRSIMEDSGVTLARVGVVKAVARYHHLVSLEMGVTSHGESLIGRPVKHWDIVNDYELRDAEPFAAFIAGNLCFSGDMLSRYKVLFKRKPKRGDIIMIHDTGAYSSSLLASASNAYPRPARILVDENGNPTVMKHRDTYLDIIQ